MMTQSYFFNAKQDSWQQNVDLVFFPFQISYLQIHLLLQVILEWQKYELSTWFSTVLLISLN